MRRPSRLLGLAAITGVLLSACSDGTTRSEGASAGTLSGTITVRAAGGEGELKAVQALADAFVAAHPGTKVDLVTLSNPGDLVAKLTTEFAARTPPDVFVLNYRRLGDFAKKGVIEPVKGLDTTRLYQGTVDAFSYDEDLLCLPSNASSMVVYVNPKLFARAGVPLPKPGWTWDDMLTAAQAIAAKRIEAIGFEPSLIRLAPFVWSAGGEVVDDPVSPGRVSLESPQARSALTFMLNLQRFGLDATQRAAQDPEATFSAGNLAMYLDSRRAVPSFRKTAGLTFDVAPVPTQAAAVSVLHSDGYCVSRQAKNKRLAQAFAEYAVLGDGAIALTETGRTVPAARDIAASAAFLSPGKAPASSQVFLDQLSAARALPLMPGWNETEEVVEEILAQLFAGRIGMDEAINQIASRTAEELLGG